MNSRSTFRTKTGRPSFKWIDSHGGASGFVLFFALSFCFFSNLAAQSFEKTPLSLEKMVYPETQLCLLDVRGKAASYPFDMSYFRDDLLSLLRSENYLTIKTEEDVKHVLERNRISVPEVYDPRPLTSISRITDCEYVGYLRMIAFEMNLHDGFSIPFFFKRNKVTYNAELDVAVLDGKTGSLQYSKKVIGEMSLGRSIQNFPVTEDPSLYLNFHEKETLARGMMEDLARRTFDSLLKGIHKTLGEKYICYWHDVVHIISEKSGLCPICGSRLVKIVR